MTTFLTLYHHHPVLITILAALGFASLTGFVCLWAMLKTASYSNNYDDDGAERDSKRN